MSRRRILFVAALFAPVTCLALDGCSDDEGVAVDPTADAAGRDVGKGPEAAAGEDDAEAGPVPPPEVPTCLGAALPLVQSGERSYVKVSMGRAVVDAGTDADAGDGAVALEGHFLIDYGANASTIDLKAFDPPGPTPFDCAGDPSLPGAQCSFAPFDFFGLWGNVSLYTADYSFLFNSVKQAGIIGTDFLAIHAFTFDYYGRRFLKATKDSLCGDAQLVTAGWVALPTGGFFANDTKKLRPLSEVITTPDAGVARFTVPNVPTVPITIGGVRALAQLDTGYDDRIRRHAINVNQAFVDQLLALQPPKLLRNPSLDLYLTTCVIGVNQKATGYQLENGTEIDFLGEGGALARRQIGGYVYVKEKLAEAERCGGIDTWTVPAAQMGASFLVDAQAALFDPFSARVWLPKR